MFSKISPGRIDGVSCIGLKEADSELTSDRSCHGSRVSWAVAHGLRNKWPLSRRWALRPEFEAGTEYADSKGAGRPHTPLSMLMPSRLPGAIDFWFHHGLPSGLGLPHVVGRLVPHPSQYVIGGYSALSESRRPRYLAIQNPEPLSAYIHQPLRLSWFESRSGVVFEKRG